MRIFAGSALVYCQCCVVFLLFFCQREQKNLSFNEHEESGERAMSLKKQYLKKHSACKVTFSFPKEAAGPATHVSLVGDFNAWDKHAIPMKRLKNGGFTATVTLESNKEYHFRYFLDGDRWENDWNADKYVPNNHGSDDSVVVV
jgi:1,4-alpha-glucan branching enzyme